MKTVHPRWRGEQDHGRGPVDHGLRFIPAGAGNSCRAATQEGVGAVHPRWRGEQLCAVLIAPVLHGSSPLARGTAVLAHAAALVARFIPAGAGNRQHHVP